MQIHHLNFSFKTRGIETTTLFAIFFDCRLKFQEAHLIRMNFAKNHNQSMLKMISDNLDYRFALCFPTCE